MFGAIQRSESGIISLSYIGEINKVMIDSKTWIMVAIRGVEFGVIVDLDV